MPFDGLHVAPEAQVTPSHGPARFSHWPVVALHFCPMGQSTPSQGSAQRGAPVSGAKAQCCVGEQPKDAQGSAGTQ